METFPNGFLITNWRIYGPQEPEVLEYHEDTQSNAIMLGGNHKRIQFQDCLLFRWEKCQGGWPILLGGSRT